MAEQICPTCGCEIGEGGLEKDGIIYCSGPCVTGNQCECGCCSAVEEKENE